jgi:hypothetical protein
MSYRNTNNIYAVGTIIATKANPNVKLVVNRYDHGLYYCSVVTGEQPQKELAYFERELRLPA